MPIVRTNQAWLEDLRSEGAAGSAAVEDLHSLLLRAAKYSFQRSLSDLAGRSPEEIHQMAQDCAQDALIAVLDNLSSFRGESQFTTWAYKFAINISLTMARRERWKGVSLDQLDEQSMENRFPRSARSTSDPDRSALHGEIADILSEAIRTDLTEKQRFVLKMIVFEEVPMDVVVERMQSNRNAVYKLLHDARRKLKHRLESHGFGVGEILDAFHPAG
jgi:RNA polymerase sigma-70 factor (ECF subfamily)